MSIIFTQESVKICSYNILNFSGNSGNRVQYFQNIILELDADILVVQEMINSSGVQLFLNVVLNQSYSASPFIDGPDTDNMFFFRVPVNLISNQVVSTTLRDINGYTVSIGVDTLTIYSVHLKASQGNSNEQQRLSEVQDLHQELITDYPYIVLGDFNIYESSEPAFQYLINNIGFSDPINQIGDWHDNYYYSSIHTQSTRTSTIGDGGSTGGMDDRFDMILISDEVIYDYGTYHAYGNDGQHFNESINDGSNQVVSQNIANSLYYASDHLPVCAEFEFNTAVLGDINGDGDVNVIDVVIAVNMILGEISTLDHADINQDGLVNVVDVVLLVNIVLE